jgi:CheY-like chemotaxis protein
MHQLATVMNSVSSSGSDPEGNGLSAAGAQRATERRFTLRVLVVDDLARRSQQLARLLRHMGHDVTTAYDGLSALQATESFRPQVVFLDIGLRTRRVRSRRGGFARTL